MDNNRRRERLDSLAEAFMEQHRRGEHPEISAYVAQHPELADEIRGLFPTVAALEGLKQQRGRSPLRQIRAGSEHLKQLGEFSVIRELGRGGMGVVFEAVQETLDRRVALKVLPKQSLMNDDALARFQREARIAAHLQHPNIVPIYSIGEVEGHHFIAMQCIRGIGWDRLIKRLVDAQQGNPLHVPPSIVDEGRLLRHLAARHHTTVTNSAVEPDDRDTETGSRLLPSANGRTGGTTRPDQNLYDRCLPPVSRPYDFGLKYCIEAGKMGLQAAEALSYAHEQGIWHRDVKPANLILDTHGRVWITDFGLAKARESEDITRTGSIMGTLRFMAPENFDGHTDAKSDIYSLGLTLYELFTLQPAYRGKNQSELIRKILYTSPPLPRSINPDIPPDLESIVLKAAARDPDQRYKTTMALARDIKRFLDREAITVLPVTLPRETEPGRRHKSTVSRVVGGLVLIMALIAVGMLAKNPIGKADMPMPAAETQTAAAPAPVPAKDYALEPDRPESADASVFGNEEEDAFEPLFEDQAADASVFGNGEEDASVPMSENEASVDPLPVPTEESLHESERIEAFKPPVHLQDRPVAAEEGALPPPPPQPGMRPPPQVREGERRPPGRPPLSRRGSPPKGSRPHRPPRQQGPGS